MRKILWQDVVSGGEAFHAARQSHGRTIQTPDHTHDFAEVFWISGGEGIHRLNGELFPLVAGSLVLIRPPDFHGIETISSDPLLLTNIAFPRETLDFLGNRYFSDRLWAFWENGRQPMVQQIDGFQTQLFDHWANELARSPREPFYIERFLLNLLNELNPPYDRQWPTNTPDWLIHACREIQKPAYFVEGVPAFVRLTGYSREHAARCLRQFAGATPTAIVNRARLTHAAHLLEMSQQGILEIALSCGIDNLSHFYKLFQAQYGVTPRAYRLAHRKTL